MLAAIVTTAASLRVGVYVDGFNVYYGGRAHCGRHTKGWRWLDLAGLSRSLINPNLWPGAVVDRLVYCTAWRERAGDPTSLTDQRVYINALQEHSPMLRLAEGKYVPRDKSGILLDRRAVPISRIPSPGIRNIPDWLDVREVTGPSGATELLTTVATFEEKGSDVNVASHLLIDVLTGQIDAAIVVSNDSDLRFPLAYVRDYVPVGTVNPGTSPTSRDLRGSSSDGVGRHWWRRLRTDDYTSHQLPDPAGSFTKPAAW